MKYNLELHHNNNAVVDSVFAKLATELSKNKEVNLVDEPESDSHITRGGKVSLVIEILGGLLTVFQIAELIYNTVIKKDVEIVMKNKEGSKVRIKATGSEKEIKELISNFLSINKE